MGLDCGGVPFIFLFLDLFGLEVVGLGVWFCGVHFNLNMGFFGLGLGFGIMRFNPFRLFGKGVLFYLVTNGKQRAEILNREC